VAGVISATFSGAKDIVEREWILKTGVAVGGLKIDDLVSFSLAEAELGYKYNQITHTSESFWDANALWFLHSGEHIVNSSENEDPTLGLPIRSTTFIAVQSVREPDSLLLLSIGLATILIVFRKRQNLL
jgi:hypothetical protein